MHAVRHLLVQRHLTVLLCAATLLLKLLVPAGYMIASEHGRIAVTICSGIAPGGATVAMPGMHHGMPDHGKPKEHDKAEMPCAFSGLSAQALGAVDPILLGALIAFIVAVGLWFTARLAPPGRGHLRPPLRGPPATL